MWLICGILFTLNVSNLEKKTNSTHPTHTPPPLPPSPPKKQPHSFENTLLLNMIDYEQIKFYAKMVAES